jgi:glycerol dehydrogenase-like iron-containing ADH family enzyme
MSNNKQSSVDWFANESWQLKVQLDNQEISVDEYAVAYVRLLYKAKAMHKEEITQAWKKGDGQFDKVSDKMSFEYYEQTYGGGEQ